MSGIDLNTDRPRTTRARRYLIFPKIQFKQGFVTALLMMRAQNHRQKHPHQITRTFEVAQEKSAARVLGDRGFSLIEVIIAIGLMGLVATTSATLMVDQNRQIKSISGKIATNDTKNSLIAVMQNPAVCAANLDTAIDPLLVFDSTVADPSINFTRIRSGIDVASPPVIEVGQDINVNSGVTVASISLRNLTDIGANRWSGVWVVTLNTPTGSTPLRPITLNVQQFDVDVASPANAKRLTGCYAVSGATGSLSQWTSNAADIYFGELGGNVGIGITNPTSKLDVVGGDVQIQGAGGTSGRLRLFDEPNGDYGSLTLTDSEFFFRGVADGPAALVADAASFRALFTTEDVRFGDTWVGRGAGNVLTNTRVGRNTLLFNTSGSGNTAIGGSVLQSNTTGAANTALGLSSLFYNTTGSNNTAIGNSALFNLLTGSNNIAVGGSAMSLATTGSSNIAIGGAAGSNITTGNFNLIIGQLTASVDTGNYNTVIGSQNASVMSGASNQVSISDGQGNERFRSDAVGNVGLGTSTPVSRLDVNGTISLRGIQGLRLPDSDGVAGASIAIGPGALLNQTVPAAYYGNVAIGRNALRDTTVVAGNAGVENIALGNWALYQNTTGDYNFAVGASSLLDNTVGSENIAIGPNSLQRNVSGVRNIAMGGGASAFNTSGGRNIALGYGALSANQTGSLNVAFGVGSLSQVRGDENIGVGFAAGSSLLTGVGNISIGVQANVASDNASNQLSIGNLIYGTNLDGRLSGVSSGNIGIGVPVPTSKLQVAGDITPRSTGSNNLGSGALRWQNIYLTNAPDVSSDSRLKKDIETSDLGLDFINSLRPVSWVWKDPKQGTSRHYGVIAQEAESAIAKAKGLDPSNVIVSHDKKSDSYSVRYTELIAPLIKAIQELYHSLLGVKSDVDQLKLENAELKARVDRAEQENVAMKARLDQIEKMLK